MTEARRCDVDGCSSATREGKPYCTDHVAHHVYVADLLLRIEAREHESRLVADGSLPPEQSEFMAREFLSRLVHDYNGIATCSNLARALNLPEDVTKGLAKKLSRVGVVRLGLIKQALRVRYIRSPK